MGLSDKIVGYGLIGVSIIIFTYYTAWVCLMPFIPSDSLLHDFFLPQHYAIAIPATLLCVGLALIGLTASLILLSSIGVSKKKSL
jgi:dolichol phosphate-mannose biosynthesis regulatory protein